MPVVKHRVFNALAAVSLAVLVGCQAPVTTRAELDEMVQQSYHNSLVDYLYYEGSTADFDYYYVAGTVQSTYRVARESNHQDDRVPLTSDQTKWRRLQ
jgi:hypothetical protein